MANFVTLTHRLLIISWLFVLWLPANAQNGTNPFDLQHRLDKTQKQQDTIADNTTSNPFDIESRLSNPADDAQTEAAQNVDTTIPEPETNTNPFDIRRPGTKPVTPTIAPSSSAPAAKSSDPVPKVSSRGGFVFWSILGLMIFLAMMVTLYRNLLGKIYRAFTNENVLKLLQREQGGIVKPPYWLLYIMYFLSSGIFIFLVARYYGWVPHEFRFLSFCIAGVTGFFLLKHLLLKFIEGIFPVAKEIKQYSFTIVIFNIILGIMLIPFNIFIAFATDNLTFTGIIIALLAILVVYLFRLLRGAMISTKFLAFHKFHFFMYLCTIEIAPLLIIIKMFMNGVSIQ